MDCNSKCHRASQSMKSLVQKENLTAQNDSNWHCRRGECLYGLLHTTIVSSRRRELTYIRGWPSLSRRRLFQKGCPVLVSPGFGEIGRGCSSITALPLMQFLYL